MSVRCQKCGYQRKPGDGDPEYICPCCGVVYAHDAMAKARFPDAVSFPLFSLPEATVTAFHDSRQGDEKARDGFVITNINIPFWRLVRLFIYIAVAAIPASFILWSFAYGLIAISKDTALILLR